MRRQTALFIVFLLPIFLTACGKSNSEAPLNTEPHSLKWSTTHSSTPAVDGQYPRCTSCHGPDLTGNGSAPSCYSCHIFNYTPPMTKHPANWTNTIKNHDSTASSTCTACHGRNLEGYQSAPSCFSCHVFNSALPISVHSEKWTDLIADHGSGKISLCSSCHGSNLSGSKLAPSCYSCHIANGNQTITVHPAGWATAFIDHRATTNTVSCSGCHGKTLQGSSFAPSCFSSVNKDGLYCHADGPGLTPHALDGTFLDGAIHGSFAKKDLLVCQACHAQPVAVNPRFNVGIKSQGNTGCEACHGINLAHPINWDGVGGALSHEDAKNLRKACALCHGKNLDGVGGNGVSCFSCHDFEIAG